MALKTAAFGQLPKLINFIFFYLNHALWHVHAYIQN